MNRASGRWHRLVAVACCVLLAACSVGAQTTTSPSRPSTTTRGSSTTSSTTTTTTTTTAPTTTTTKVRPPALRKPTPGHPLEVIVAGDSTAFSIGWAVVRADTHHLLAATVMQKTSSGLSRPDFFDWPKAVRWIAATNPPEVILLSLGANDAQGVISPDGVTHSFGSPGWIAEYRRRVEGVSKRLAASGSTVYWLAQPFARNTIYTRQMRVVDDVEQTVCKAMVHVACLSTSSALARHGAYTDTLPGPDGKPVAIRQEDGIHLTSAGADRVAARILDRLRADWGG